MSDPVQNRVTDKEAKILAALAAGMTNAGIAVMLGISKDTVKMQLKRIFRKIGAENRVRAAVLYATGKIPR